MSAQKSARRSHVLLVRLCVTAMMIALSVVLCRFLGWAPPDTGARVEIGFLPIAVVGMLYGPVWSTAAYAVSDLIGAVITTGINPFIMLCKAAFGLCLGLGLFSHRPKMGMGEFSVRSVATVVVSGFFVDMLLMSAVFVFMGYYPDYAAAFVVRAINTGINAPIRIVLLIALYPAIRKLIAKYKAKGVFTL